MACVCFALLCGARVPCSFVRRACTPKPTRSERVLGTDYCISWACELRGVCSRKMRSALIVLSIGFHLFVLFWHTGRILPEQLLGFVDSVVFCPILPRTRSNSSHDLKHLRTSNMSHHSGYELTEFQPKPSRDSFTWFSFDRGSAKSY